jgi:DNA-directed RNA polymerase II subunit RPB1
MMIKNSKLIFGIVNKKTTGSLIGGLFHVMFREKGLEPCRNLFLGLQRVVVYWLVHNNFSIGIGDTIADPGTMEVITDMIRERKDKVATFIADAYSDRLKQSPGMLIRGSFESTVNQELNEACNKVGKYAQTDLENDNNIKEMVTAGSKGLFITSFTRPAVRQGQVHAVRLPVLHALTLHQGPLWASVVRVCQELVNG